MLQGNEIFLSRLISKTRIFFYTNAANRKYYQNRVNYMTKKPIHSGHRARTKDKFIASEFEYFNEHQILEMLLFYCIPRVDTNPIAHELINHYGSLANVLDASVDSLRKFGLSERAAVFLNMIPIMSQSYLYDKNYNLNKMFNETAFKKRLVTFSLKNMKNDIILAFFDSAGTELFFGPVKWYEPERLIPKFTDLSMKYNAVSAIICTRNRFGLPVPERDELEIITAVAEGLDSINVQLKNWYILSDTDVISLAERPEVSYLFIHKKNE